MIKVLIEDYLKDRSDVRLKILLANMNPSFVLSKKNKDMVLLVLSDYEKDKSTKRLKAIHNLIGDVSIKVSPKKKKVYTAFEDDDFSKITREMTELNKQILDAKGDKMILSALQPVHAELSGRLDIAIRQRDKLMLSQLDPVQIEKDLIIRLFGDPSDTNSHAHKILNGFANDFRIQMLYDPTVMIKKLFNFNSKEPYTYTAGLIDPQNRVWRVTKGEGVPVYDMGTRGI